MIGKKVAKNAERAGRKSKASNIRDLTDYIAAPGTEEKLLYENGRNFLSGTLPAQQAEMIALAQEAPRSRDPVSHYILSWREGEQPTDDQAEHAVTVLLEELGLEEHQAIYGLHRDTDNVHLHVAVNRVHPENHRVVKPNKGFDIEAVHKAVARIEHEQAWQPERFARYVVREDGSVARRDIREAGPRQPRQRSRDFEQRTGAKSAERIAIEDAAPILRDARTWAELHERLEGIGARLVQKGTGGLLWIGEQPVKPSAVDRGASFGALQKRLGPFTPQQAQPEGAEHDRRDPAAGGDPADPVHRSGRDAGDSEPGGVPRGPEPDASAARTAEARRGRNGVHGVPARSLAADWDRAHLLLPRDVPDELVERAPAPDPLVRRDDTRRREGRVGEGVQAALLVLRTARTWEELHQRLAELRIGYERKGSGAILRVDEHVIKASAAHRTVALRELERRLGPFRPATSGSAAVPTPAPNTARPLRASPAEWATYMAERTAHYARKEAALIEQRKNHDAARATLREQQRVRREEVLAAATNRTVRQAMRSVLAAEQAAQKADLRDRLDKERVVFRVAHPRFPDLEQWLRARDSALADRWRYRASEPAEIVGPSPSEATPRDIRHFSASVHGANVHYHREATADAAAAAFIDRGRAIHVHETQDRAAVLASLQLAAQKWGRFKVAGDDSYKALCAQLAVEHGFRLDNPELEETIREGRAARRPPPPRDPRPPVPRIGSSPPPECRGQARSIAEDFHPASRVAGACGRPEAGRPEAAPPAAPPPSEQGATSAERSAGEGEESAVRKSPPNVLAEFDRYHAAVGAERYRVTAIHMSGDGQKKAFVLDKKDGVSLGLAPRELRARTREMLRLEARNENLYYTPLSTTKHHILVDDMSREKLERLVGAGFKPAVVLESSPGNFQAVLTVAKLGTPYDREIGNRLSLFLNREYGDPNLSGAIHPHRAPGYTNRKPSRQLPDGSYPEVKLLRAEARECDRSLAFCRELLAEREAADARGRSNPPVAAPPSAEPAATAVAAYYEHLRDVTARFGGDSANYSRVDSMIALRLRATGHAPDDIAGALERCAPTIRPPEKQGSHQWQDYARRTVAYALGPAGDQQLEKTRRYHEQWRQMEAQPARTGEPRISARAPDAPDI
jgi:hypothetical protein